MVRMGVCGGLCWVGISTYRKTGSGSGGGRGGGGGWRVGGALGGGGVVFWCGRVLGGGGGLRRPRTCFLFLVFFGLRFCPVS